MIITRNIYRIQSCLNFGAGRKCIFMQSGGGNVYTGWSVIFDNSDKDGLPVKSAFDMKCAVYNTYI